MERGGTQDGVKSLLLYDKLQERSDAVILRKAARDYTVILSLNSNGGITFGKLQYLGSGYQIIIPCDAVL